MTTEQARATAHRIIIEAGHDPHPSKDYIIPGIKADNPGFYYAHSMQFARGWGPLTPAIRVKVSLVTGEATTY